MSEEFKLTLDTAVEEVPAPTLTLTPEQPEVAAKQEEVPSCQRFAFS